MAEQFFGHNKQFLVINDECSMSRSNNFAITDLNKVSQVVLPNNEATKIAAFIVKNMGIYGGGKETRANNKNILKYCLINELLYAKSDIVHICNGIQITINDKQKNEYYHIEHIQDNFDKMNEVKVLIEKIETIIKSIDLNNEDIEYLKERGIYVLNKTFLGIIASLNCSDKTLEIGNHNEIKIKNTSYERKKYLESINSSQNQFS